MAKSEGRDPVSLSDLSAGGFLASQSKRRGDGKGSARAAARHV